MKSLESFKIEKLGVPLTRKRRVKVDVVGWLILRVIVDTLYGP